MSFVKIDNSIFEILKKDHIKMGRGSGIDRISIKNLETGAIMERTYKSNQDVEEVDLDRKKIQFLYKENDKFFFMDNESFEQYELDLKIIGNFSNFLKEGDEIDALFYNNRILTVQTPLKVKLKVVSAEPATKGNSVDSPTKTVEFETGFRTQVPLFIKEGDMIIVNTESGKYVERAKE
ncbi:MAG: elongation factor P [Patescibacteria group bacterium]|jgi:elongation factor P